MDKTQIERLQQKALLIRRDLTEMLFRSASGHWGGSLGLADVFTVLFFGGILRYNAKKPEAKDRDRFILSNGHIAPLYYTVLEHAGFFGDKKPALRKIGSPLQGHPSHTHLAVVETSTGPLGQGVGVAVGKAIALKMQGSSARVFCITSDGEHEEGSTWEAVASAGKYRLDNLIYILDRNHVQISGTTEDVGNLGNIGARYRDLGWEVLEVNGHDIGKLLRLFDSFKYKSRKPRIVIARTIMGKGVKQIENDYHYHGKAPSEKEYLMAMAELK
ncbi:MAG TPA: transketolase [Patescibacteria group bacterium]|nr:transketolase [Patescibacteria group bacterium]